MAESSSPSWTRGPLIGCGTHARINTALDVKTGNVFAVKTVDSFSFEILHSLERERRLLSGIKSSRVVAVHGADWTLENGCLKRNLHLEYIPGGNLLDVLRGCKNRFDEMLIMQYTRGILEALRDIHEQNMVHCDLKCKNVLLGVDGVKLANFGSARVLGRPTKKSDLNYDPKSFYWMPPEQALGFEIDSTAGDIWSLGCTVIEMATGGNPWGTQSALFKLCCTDGTPDIPSNLSRQCQDFLQVCLQRDPRKRPSAIELLSHPFFHSRSCKRFGSVPESSGAELLLEKEKNDASDDENDFSAFRSYFKKVEETSGRPLTLRVSSSHGAAGGLDLSDAEGSTEIDSGLGSSRSWWSSSSSPIAGQGHWLVVRSPTAQAAVPEPAWSAQEESFDSETVLSCGMQSAEEGSERETDRAALLSACLTFKGML